MFSRSSILRAAIMVLELLRRKHRNQPFFVSSRDMRVNDNLSADPKSCFGKFV